ncbi:hypothetical protein HNR02_006467 [Amycolatopsis endophytica]|uniref:Uncharacterized protein n=1 Tax=Amycolatopsis endophytica TaxID=860233 RepID=A0A853BEI9_9PSEU|nr:hypothetical protein [Amycolatopsis endophytica]NYI93092.1 hypothetical protein [Amycolatopsis endophytica]
MNRNRPAKASQKSRPARGTRSRQAIRRAGAGAPRSRIATASTTATTTISHGAISRPVDGLVTSAPASTPPAVCPARKPNPANADARPTEPAGTWSGISAASAADHTPMASWNTAYSAPPSTWPVVSPVAARLSTASTDEPSSHGERRPSRPRVRSDSRPPATVPSALVTPPATA